MTEERKPCPAPECGAYDGHHSPGCPLASLEYKAERMVVYYKKWLEERGRSALERTRLRDLVTLWQGKHRIVKHENNKLRFKFQDSRSTRLPPGWTWGRNGAVCFVTAPGGETWHGDTEAAAICAAMKALWERLQ